MQSRASRRRCHCPPNQRLSRSREFLHLFSSSVERAKAEAELASSRPPSVQSEREGGNSPSLVRAQCARPDSRERELQGPAAILRRSCMASNSWRIVSLPLLSSWKIPLSNFHEEFSGRSCARPKCRLPSDGRATGRRERQGAPRRGHMEKGRKYMAVGVSQRGF